MHILDRSKPVPIIAANRLQRYALILQSFDYQIQYIKSSENKADFLSRLPIPEILGNKKEDCSNLQSSDYFIDIITELNSNDLEDDKLCVIATETNLNIQTISSSSEKDLVISNIMKYLNTGWPTKK